MKTEASELERSQLALIEAKEASGESLLEHFDFAHLPPKLADLSSRFADLAVHVVQTCERGPERTTALRKLLEAKDCAVRQLRVDTLRAPARVTAPVRVAESIRFDGHNWRVLRVEANEDPSTTSPDGLLVYVTAARHEHHDDAERVVRIRLAGWTPAPHAPVSSWEVL